MGNNGFYKLFSKNDHQIDTIYKDIKDIPFMDLNRNYKKIKDYNTNNFIIINTGSQNINFNQEIINIKNIANKNKNIKIFLFPSNSNNNELNSFNKIKQIYSDLPKNVFLMATTEIKGQYCSQLYKNLFKYINNKPDVTIHFLDFCKFHFNKDNIKIFKPNDDFMIN